MTVILMHDDAPKADYEKCKEYAETVMGLPATLLVSIQLSRLMGNCCTAGAAKG